MFLLISMNYTKLVNSCAADFSWMSPNEDHDRFDGCSFTVAGRETSRQPLHQLALFPETLSIFSPEVFWLWETISCEPVPMETCRRPRHRCDALCEEQRCHTANDQTHPSGHLLFQEFEKQLTALKIYINRMFTRSDSSSGTLVDGLTFLARNVCRAADRGRLLL